MVAIIPNFASVTGTVEAIEPSDFGDAFDTVTLSISELTTHENYPNLVRPLAGNRLKIFLRRATREALGLTKGVRLSAVIRAAGGDKYYSVDDSVKVEP
jgi:hypothetical protein